MLVVFMNNCSFKNLNLLAPCNHDSFLVNFLCIKQEPLLDYFYHWLECWRTNDQPCNTFKNYKLVHVITIVTMMPCKLMWSCRTITKVKKKNALDMYIIAMYINLPNKRTRVIIVTWVYDNVAKEVHAKFTIKNLKI